MIHFLNLQIISNKITAIKFISCSLLFWSTFAVFSIFRVVWRFLVSLLTESNMCSSIFSWYNLSMVCFDHRDLFCVGITIAILEFKFCSFTIIYFLLLLKFSWLLSFISTFSVVFGGGKLFQHLKLLQIILWALGFHRKKINYFPAWKHVL